MMRALSLGVLCLFVCTIALAQHTHIAFDHHADFSGFHTYAWQPSPSPADGEWNERIVSGIDHQLQAKGLTKTDSDPDLWLIYTSKIEKEHSAFGGGYIYGPEWGSSYPGVPSVPTSWDEGTLAVEIADAKTKQVVWRGAVSNAISDKSKKNLKALDKDIAKLFQQYPPKTTK